MALQFIVSIHGGGRRNQSPYEVSFELFPSDSVAHRTRSASAFPCVHYSSIAEECSKKVQLALNASQDLRRNIVIATVGDLGWEETTGDVLDVQQQPQRLDAVVVPTFLTSGEAAELGRRVLCVHCDWTLCYVYLSAHLEYIMPWSVAHCARSMQAFRQVQSVKVRCHTTVTFSPMLSIFQVPAARPPECS